MSELHRRGACKEPEVPSGESEVSSDEDNEAKNNEKDNLVVTAQANVDSEEGEDECHNYANTDIMKSGDLHTIDKLPQLGGLHSVAYQSEEGEVMMPTKLYTRRMSIEEFIEDNVVEKWKVGKKWITFLQHQGRNHFESPLFIYLADFFCEKSHTYVPPLLCLHVIKSHINM